MSAERQKEIIRLKEEFAEKEAEATRLLESLRRANDALGLANDKYLAACVNMAIAEFKLKLMEVLSKDGEEP